jgi:hypothetical protein
MMGRCRNSYLLKLMRNRKKAITPSFTGYLVVTSGSQPIELLALLGETET